MTQHNQYPSAELCAQPLPQSFTTARGSVYEYDEQGRTTRHKLATDEVLPTQDITVFVDLEGDALNYLIEAVQRRDQSKDERVYVVERDEDDSARKIRSTEEIIDPSKLFLAIFHNGKPFIAAPAQLMPKVGLTPYDMRSYYEGKQRMTERHVGHKVTGLNH